MFFINMFSKDKSIPGVQDEKVYDGYKTTGEHYTAHGYQEGWITAVTQKRINKHWKN